MINTYPRLLIALAIGIGISASAAVVSAQVRDTTEVPLTEENAGIVTGEITAIDLSGDQGVPFVLLDDFHLSVLPQTTVTRAELPVQPTSLREGQTIRAEYHRPPNGAPVAIHIEILPRGRAQ